MLSCSDKTNYSAYKFQESVLGEFSDVCAPLFRYFGSSTFSYMKFFSDGSYLSLNNSLPWQKYYFENIRCNGDAEWEDCSLLSYAHNLDTFVPFMWPKAPCSQLTQRLYDSDIWNGFGYIKQTSDCVEMWCVNSAVTNTPHRDFWIRNKQTLLEFIYHFNSALSDALSVDNNTVSKLAFYKEGCAWSNFLSPKQADVFSNQQLDEALNKCQSRYKTLLNGVSFTAREIQCLSHLARGETCKMIAYQLGISFRTVEMHLNNIKHKTNLHMRSDLVKLYQDRIF